MQTLNSYCDYARDLSAHNFFLCKKEKRVFGFAVGIYGRFLTAIKMTAPTSAIATMIAAVAPTMYMSVFDAGASGSGVGVAGEGSTANEVTALEG